MKRVAYRSGPVSTRPERYREIHAEHGLGRPGDAVATSLEHPGIYEHAGSRAAAQLAGRPPPPGVTVNRVGSMFTFFFNEGPVTDWESAKRSDTQCFGKFFHFMLERGIYLAPSQFEAGFISAAHSVEDIGHTVEAAREFF